MPKLSKKEASLVKLQKAWESLLDSLRGLTDDQMLESGVTGEWSVKDILAHISWWEEEALKHLPTILKGGKPPRYSDQYGGIDAFNAKMTQLKQALPLPEVLRELKETHQRLIDYLQSIPEEQFAAGTRFQHRLQADTRKHYPIHEAAIREWRDKYS